MRRGIRRFFLRCVSRRGCVGSIPHEERRERGLAHPGCVSSRRLRIPKPSSKAASRACQSPLPAGFRECYECYREFFEDAPGIASFLRFALTKITCNVFTVISLPLYELFSYNTNNVEFAFATLMKNSQERGLAHPGGGFGRRVRSP